MSRFSKNCDTPTRYCAASTFRTKSWWFWTMPYLTCNLQVEGYHWTSYYNVTSHMYVLWSLCNVLLVARGFITDLWHHFEFVCCLTNIKFMLTSREGTWAKLGMEFCEHMMWRHLFSYLPKGRVHLEILDNTLNICSFGLQVNQPVDQEC